MKRALLTLAILIVLVVGVVSVAWSPLFGQIRRPIRVGLLHSLVGTMASSEKSMIEAEILALEEINAAGGLLGRRVEWIIADGRSDPVTFAREAERLLDLDKVSILFGCYTSSCRKLVKPVVERFDTLLIYPVAYEGLEHSPNIIYTGAAPNQQIIPTINWCRDQFRAKSFYLIGSDFLWPRAANAIIKDQITAFGGKIAGEDYIPFGGNEFDKIVQKVVDAKPDVVLSTVAGDSNLAFYKAIRAGKHDTSQIPILTYFVAEDELRSLPVREMVNDYAACNYFQTLPYEQNLNFVRRFKARYGKDRVTSDVIATAYNSVYLWASAVRDAETEIARDLKPVLLRESLDAPEGIISLDNDSQHTWRPYFVGKVRSDGQFEIVYSSTKPVRPIPYPFSRTRSEWEAFLDALYQGWHGQWVAPSGRREDRAS